MRAGLAAVTCITMFHVDRLEPSTHDSPERKHQHMLPLTQVAGCRVQEHMHADEHGCAGRCESCV